ncbi:MAG: tetratricopeptide repeat protein [Epsilonproteobacteria bacterium]|nr:tetratricopeptide repeat protein [Campylobacterales bacterium]MBD3823398.1 tetratricopeptide repeat protein [Campylobacterota bacterium]
MKKLLLAALCAAITHQNLYSNEPSAFGAGDLTNPNPYGLTPNEQALLETKKNLQKVVVTSNNQANQVDSLRERLDGLQSIVESIGRKAQENKIALEQFKQESLNLQKNREEYDKRVQTLIEKNAQDIEKLNLVSVELSKLLDAINKNYITKDEFNNLVVELNNFKSLVSKEIKSSGSESARSDLDTMSRADVMKKANEYYSSKNYTKSIEYFSYLIEKNYKPAQSHYMIGEMYYYRKDYSDAIAYYKKSASLYQKASYMPVLMLHTAVSMEKTGDKENAINFYNAVIAKYSDTKAAQEAKRYLEALK